MNLILLTQDDVNDSRLARVRDPRRLAHLRQVHRAQQGNVMTLGIENGPLGRGTLLSLDEDEACFDVSGLDQAPPEALPVHLVLEHAAWLVKESEQAVLEIDDFCQ